MIVKDEEKYLSQCLDSVKSVVNQMIILDTGSKDNTIQIAKDYGAEVYEKPWNHHFSESRNESISHANCDWILWMDADEVLDPNSISELRQRIRTDKQVYFSVRISSRNQYEKKITYSDAHRIFKNFNGIKFENRIHEQIYNSANSLGFVEENTSIHLIHEGYNLNQSDYRKKLIRNLPLLERMVEENIEDGYAHYTLAQNYAGLKRFQESIIQFQKALMCEKISTPLKINIFNVMAQSYSELGNWDEVKKYSEKSIALSNLQSGAYYMLFKYAENKNDFAQSIVYLKKILSNTERLKTNPQKIENDISISEQHILKTIGDNFVKLGDIPKAFEYWCQLDDHEITKSFIFKTISLPQEKNEWFWMIKIINKYLTIQSEAEIEIYDMLGQSYIKTNQLDSALKLYLKLFEEGEKNPIVYRRLAALYAKLGSMSKAEEFVSQLNEVS